MSLKNMIGALNFISGQRKTQEELRRLSLSAGKLFRGPVAKAEETLDGISAVARFVEDEANSWLEPDAFEAGASGPFDACDLRHWLLFAEAAGVPFVPARQIATLTEEELSAIDHKISLPKHVAASISKGLARVLPDITPSDPGSDVDPAAIQERLFTAMDDVPADWMVRSNISGSSMLKSLAGTGLLDDGREGAQLAENVEVGAGWVRVGNRTRIDATDKRFVECFVRGHKDKLHYLARPWMTADRYGEGEDPHRHGSHFAGKGRWPMEWRVFVEDGKVTGVASYYGWVGEVTAENAAKALEAAELAQKIVDQAMNMGAEPRLMDVELLRDASPAAKGNPAIAETLRRFPQGSFACTLDFMETVDGMLLLEGGPAHTPIGGGHPCAFAGHKTLPNGTCNTEGVALRLIEGVCLGDPGTWMNRANDGSILSFDEARRLAYQESPSP
jgi:hypothetical protein